jgi:hypothetical protein
VPYDVTFTHRFEVADPSIYWNDCCYAGDLILDRILPYFEGKFRDVRANQEDWGWFIWCLDKSLRLSVCIFCEDVTLGAYRLNLSAVQTRWLLPDRTADLPDLVQARDFVVREIQSWLGQVPTVSHVPAS